MAADGGGINTTRLEGSASCTRLDLRCSVCRSYTKITCTCENGKTNIFLHTAVLGCGKCQNKLVDYGTVLAARAVHRMGGSMQDLLEILVPRHEQFVLFR